LVKKISVIVSLHFGHDKLYSLEYFKNVLKGLAAQDDKNFEFCIYNDGCQDIKVSELIEKFTGKLDIKYHFEKENKGCCVGRNYAIRELATTSYVVVIDSDCIPQPNFISVWKKYFSKYDDRFTFIGNVLDRDKFRKIKLNWLDFITRHVGIFRSTFEAISGFDLDFSWTGSSKGFGSDDLDMGYRLEKTKHKFIYVLETFVTHQNHREDYSEKEMELFRKRIEFNFSLMKKKYPELKNFNVGY